MRGTAGRETRRFYLWDCVSMNAVSSLVHRLHINPGTWFTPGPSP